MNRYVPLIGYAGLLCGLTSAICGFLPGWGVFISMITMLPGFLLSSLYVMLSSRHELQTPKINPGYVGMILSTTPLVLFIIFFVTS